MAFPDTALDLRIEAAFGADLTASPLTWDWTDLSERLRLSSLSMSRGRPSEAGQVSPASMSVDLENLDGDLTPLNDAGTYYPNVRRGTPIRVWAEGATRGLLLDGTTGTAVTTPHHADFDFAGSFDIRVKLRPDQWAGARSTSDRQTIVRKATTVGGDSWTTEIEQDGRPVLRPELLFASGANELPGRLSDTRARWVAWVYDADNALGLGWWIVYTWPPYAGDPPADVTTWDLVAQSGETGSGNGALATSTSPVAIGLANTTANYRGIIEAVEIRDDINGTTVADPDFTAAAEGASTVTDSTGKVWTLAGNAEITTRRLRYAGTIDDLAVSWPLGDNNQASADPSECWTTVSSGSVLRRIQQGAKPIRSPLYRKITTNQLASSVLWGYWPMEVGQQAARAPSALDGHADMAMTGFNSTDTTILSSEPLPSIGGGQACSWSASIPSTPTGFFDNWACTFVFRMPDPDSTYRRIMAVQAGGTAVEWQVLFNSTGFRIRAENGAASQLFQTDISSPAPSTYGGWWICYLSAQNGGGGDIDWDFTALPWNDDGVGGRAITSGSFTGTIGAPTGVGTDTTTGSGSSFSIGHVTLHDYFGGPQWNVGWLDLAVTAWVGETAAARFARLCQEEDIPGEVMGDYLETVDDFEQRLGDLTLSEPMGPQQPGTFLDVLRSCAAIDGGLILERSATPGLIYRTRAAIEAAQAGDPLALDGNTTAGLRPGLAFLNDLSRYRNAWTVKAVNGGAASAIDPTAIEQQGLVDDSVELNALGTVSLGYLESERTELVPLVSTQLASIAARLLASSTVTEPRVSRLAVELLASPDKLPEWHDLTGGDRVTLDNLPAGQWPSDTVDLTVEGLKETWSPKGWLVELTCSPTATWTTPSDPTPTSLSVVGTPEWEFDNGNATVTNPDPTANGNTVLALAIGHGTANSPTIDADPPPGVTATELTGLAVNGTNIRVRAWTYPNDGAASKDFGYSGGSDNRSACILIPLDGVASVITASATPIVSNSTTGVFPGVATIAGDLVIPFAGRRANSDTPGTLTGFTVIDDDTGAAVNPQGVAWEAVTTDDPTTTPPPVIWSSSANDHAHAAVGFRA